MNMEEMRKILIDFVHQNYPYVKELEKTYYSVEDIVDQAIMEMIALDYQIHSEKKSIAQFILEDKESLFDKGIDAEQEFERLRAKYSRLIRKTNAIRDKQRELEENASECVIIDIFENDEDALVNFKKEYPLTRVAFEELKSLANCDLFYDLINKRIVSAKKVSGDVIRTEYSDYQDYIQAKYNEMSNSEDPQLILENTLEYYNIQWKHGIEFMYELLDESSKNGYPIIPIKIINMLSGYVGILPGADWYEEPVRNVRFRMLMKRNRFLVDIFKKDAVEWDYYEAAICDAQRLIKVIREETVFDNSAQTPQYQIGCISIDEKVSFIKNHYWLWDNRKEYDLPKSKIKQLRKVYAQIWGIQ